jgi:hypothetical protein
MAAQLRRVNAPVDGNALGHERVVECHGRATGGEIDDLVSAGGVELPRWDIVFIRHNGAMTRRGTFESCLAMILYNTFAPTEMEIRRAFAAFAFPACLRLPGRHPFHRRVATSVACFRAGLRMLGQDLCMPFPRAQPLRSGEPTVHDID